MMSKRNGELSKIFTGSLRKYALGTIVILALFVSQLDAANTAVATEDTNKCVGKPNGWKYQDLLDCHGYFVCLQEKGYQTYCDHYEKFDEVNQKCVVGKCPPCQNCQTQLPCSCDGRPSGDMWRDPNDCAQFYTCVGGVITLGKCSAGLQFNTQTKTCDFKETVKCDLTAKPLGSCQDRLHGDMWRDPNDCAQFYICQWGAITLQKCSQGLQFNPIKNVCDYTENVDCKKCPSIPPTPSPPPPNSCWGRPHGDMWRDPTDCGQFYKCDSGVITLIKCSAGLVFNTELQSCDYSSNVQCGSTNPPPVTPPSACWGIPHGQIWGDVNDCQNYYVCSSGVINSQKCGSGLLFNKQTLKCDYSSNVECGSNNPPPAPSCNGGIPNGLVWGDANNCQNYYVCSSGVITSQKCGSGLLFNKQTLKCDYSSNVECGSNNPPPAPSCNGGIPNGLVWGDANNCQNYYVCSSGVITSQKCGSGLLFNKQTLKCDYSSNVECGSNNPSPVPSCNGGIPNGLVWGDANNCQQYYICSSGVIALRKCGSSLLFNKQTLKCDFSYNVKCDDPNTPAVPSPSCFGIPNGQVWEDANNCQQYYVCTSGEITINKCGSGLLFNKQKQRCDYSSNVECGSNNPAPVPPPTDPIKSCNGGIPNGQIWGDVNDCQKYYICSSGVISSQNCGSGLRFNKQTQKCDYSYNVPCGTTTSSDCDGKNDRHAFRDPTDCARYFVCAGGLKLPGKCTSGYYFDQTLMACVPRERVQCDIDGPTSPPITPTSKPPCSSCDNPCYGETGYVLYREPTNCAKVTICNAGKPISYECPAGKFFDLKIGACAKASSVDCVAVATRPTPSPSPGPSSACNGITGKTTIPDPNNCANFIICNQGISKTYACPSGKYFDLKIGACNSAQSVDCAGVPGNQPSPTPPTTPTPPFNPCDILTGYALFRDPTNCARVFIFKQGVLSAYECPSGKFFDLKTSTCAQAQLVDCQATSNLPTATTTTTVRTPFVTPAPIATTTVKDGQVDPNLRDCLGKPNGTLFRNLTHCRVYYTCRNSQAVKSSCPLGQWFDDRAFVCNFSYMVSCSAGVD